jgi:two-component sensor histidine kinase
VKTNDKLKNIPLIFYTATYTDKKDEELALKLGASKFIRKPAVRDELIKIIQCLIRDVEERKIEPKKLIFGKEKEIFKLYSERLVNKLEKKMLALEKEVTKRKRAEEQIKASLREKEVLLQEIHHRVKNNLQIISSLIKLQTKQIKDENVLEILKSTQNRVHSMAAIHDRLYQSKDFARVDFGEYVQSLTAHLFSVYRIDPKAIKLSKKIKDVFLHVNSAIPCGLIISELVSNSLKHAFPAGKKGEIKIFMNHLNKNEIELIVSDNGIGLPEGIDFRDPDSLGLHLVTILAEDQLHGDIKLDRTKGTSFHLRLDIIQ